MVEQDRDHFSHPTAPSARPCLWCRETRMPTTRKDPETAGHCGALQLRPLNGKWHEDVTYDGRCDQRGWPVSSAHTAGRSGSDVRYARRPQLDPSTPLRRSTCLPQCGRGGLGADPDARRFRRAHRSPNSHPRVEMNWQIARIRAGHNRRFAQPSFEGLLDLWSLLVEWLSLVQPDRLGHAAFFTADLGTDPRFGKQRGRQQQRRRAYRLPRGAPKADPSSTDRRAPFVQGQLPTRAAQ